MADLDDSLSLQLKETCKLTGASWAAWLERSASGWSFGPCANLSRSRQAALDLLVRQGSLATWLAGAFLSGRTRSRQAATAATDLGCQRIYLFPNLAQKSALLVGADELDRSGEGFFRILSYRYSPEAASAGFPAGPAALDLAARLVESQYPDSASAASSASAGGTPLPLGLPDVELEAAYNPVEVLKNVLEYLAGLAPCEAALLTVRSGDTFRVEAAWNYPAQAIGREIYLQESPLLREIVSSQEGLIIENQANSFTLAESLHLSIQAQAWMGAPVVLGRRVIGHLAFASAHKGAFTPDDLQRITTQAARLAYVVENAIVLSEATRYLQQLALLNELASVASLGIDTHEVAERVIQRLLRTFQASSGSVFLLSPDGNQLREYGMAALDDAAERASRVLPVRASLVGSVVQSGASLRIGDIKDAREVREQLGTRRYSTSVLAVALKYRGNAIGALSLESEASGAFSAQDETLLGVIASHLAGLFENARLNEETRQRARNLSLIQQVVRRVLGLTDIAEICLVAADLMVRRFSYELVSLILPAEHTQALVIRSARRVEKKTLSAEPETWIGLSGRVLADGNSLLSNQASVEPGYVAYASWSPGSEMCVALREGDRVIGAIDVQNASLNAFSQTDLIALEALSGVLSSVILSARRYQELQERIEAQRLAESRLIRTARLAAVGEMAAGVAHELNNPLTTVSGFVELVLEELPLDSPHRADLELVMREAQRARGVVRRMLDFSRPPDNQRIRSDLNELASDILTLVNHLARTQGIEISIRRDENLPWLSIDPAQIKQVLLNLVHNAIQAMPTGGRLEVSTRQLERDGQAWVVLTVADTGEGIRPEYLERIFEPFFTTRPAGKGTGLGLSVSYGIVTEHGGLLEVESEPGKGSCFTVFLPLDKEPTLG